MCVLWSMFCGFVSQQNQAQARRVKKSGFKIILSNLGILHETEVKSKIKWILPSFVPAAALYCNINIISLAP